MEHPVFNLSPDVWGNGTWITCTMSALRARSPERIKAFIENVVPILVTLLCNTCSGHARKIITNRHPSEYINIVDERGEYIGMFAWIVDVHNDVNKLLEKREVSWRDACKMFKPLFDMTLEAYEEEAKLIMNPETVKDIPNIEYTEEYMSKNNEYSSKVDYFVNKRYIPRSKDSRIKKGKGCDKCSLK